MTPSDEDKSSNSDKSSDDNNSDSEHKIHPVGGGQIGGGDCVMMEECPEAGTKTILTPLERAPNNVFEITKTTSRETCKVEKTASSTVTTKTTVLTTSKGWRNIFTLPISYDVNMVPSGTLLDPANLQLLDATGVHPEGYNSRFAVVDASVQTIYGDRIQIYFQAQGIDLTSIVIEGGEPGKRPDVSLGVVSSTGLDKDVL